MSNEMSTIKEKEEVIWEENHLTEHQMKLENGAEFEAIDSIPKTNIDYKQNGWNLY